MTPAADLSRAGLPLDHDGTRRAKHELVCRGLIDSPPHRGEVPDVIERSWRRCIGDALPMRPEPVQRPPDPDMHPALQDAAAPVLARLGEQLADVRVAMFLSDASGRIVMRYAHESALRSQLDDVFAAEGFDFSERSVGTNGLGTVLEERRPVLVRGTEHFNEALETVTCAGTPIVEPFTGRLLGTFSLTCESTDTNPLMGAMATDVGRQIEGNLTAVLGAGERALIRSYLLAARGDHDPVVVVNERTAFANTAGLPYLGAGAHALLWTHLGEAGRPGRTRTTVPLPGGWQDALVERVETGDATRPAWCVRLLQHAAAPDAAPARLARARPADPAPAPARPVAAAHPDPDVESQLRAAVRHRECLVLDGGPGTGKTHVATTLLAEREAGAPEVVDLSAHGPGDGPAWFTAACGALDGGRGVVLRHLQDLAAGDVNRVKALVDRARPAPGGRGPVPVVLTVDLDAAAAPVHALVGSVATTVRLPPLTELRHCIPELVESVLVENLRAGTAGERTTFSSEALQLLMAWTWPGNVAELRQTVRLLARRTPGGVVRPGDLPQRMQHAGRPRPAGTMEAAERDTIVAALRRADGNRSRAAQELGIGRTTLYRKLRMHRIPE